MGGRDAVGKRHAGDSTGGAPDIGGGLCLTPRRRRTGAGPRAHDGSDAASRRSPARQLSVLPSSLCRPNAQTTSSHCPRRLCLGHLDQSQQSRAGRWARQFGNGKGGGSGDRRHVRLADPPGASLERRHHGEPGGALGGWATSSGKEDRSLRAGPLYPPSHQQRAGVAVCGIALRPSRADGHSGSGEKAGGRRYRLCGGTLGTTGTGSVDPLPEILRLRAHYGFRLHVDAAYGGYFTLAGNLTEEARAAYDQIGQADSIVVDPHKHGLQPYGCGCVLFRDPSVGALYKHDSPYTYFTSSELHLGEISLECSRPGASAVALWATQRLLPLHKHGEFANSLERCREAALVFHQRLVQDSRFLTPFAPELDIVVFAPRAANVEEASVLTRKIFQAAARRNLHLAVAEIPVAFFGDQWEGANQDRLGLTCLRTVLMKPEHLDWLDRIWAILDQATQECLER